MMQIGNRLADRYELIEIIATGGMATVWRAADLVLGREVAVKILHPHLATDRGFLLRFRREAVAAARLSHRSIVAIYDTVSENGMEAIVMELIRGQTLRTVLDRQARLTIADVVDVGAQISEALAEAHAGGVVHRDIKPSNILLCSDRRIMVTDFGIAKAGEETDLTVTGTLLGTAKYLAPEQVNGDEIDPRADLYSLGVVLYEALTGAPPFAADTDAATALARLHQTPPPVSAQRSDIPAGLAAVVDRLMQRAPDDRFQKALDVRVALSAINIVDGPSSDATVITNQPVQQWGASGGTLAGAHHKPNPDPTAHDGLAPAPQAESSAAHEGDGVDDDDFEATDEGFLRSERSWMLPALMLALIATALLVAGALFTRPLSDSASNAGSDRGDTVSNDGSITLTPLNEFVEPTLSNPIAIDPFGDGGENNSVAGRAIDGDTDTFWATESYHRANFGNLKPGVGYLVELGGMARVREIEIESDSSDYRVEIYVGSDLTGEGAANGDYGDPLAVLAGSGNEDTELSGEGTQVLLWITDHGTSDDGSDDDTERDHRFELQELTIE